MVAGDGYRRHSWVVAKSILTDTSMWSKLWHFWPISHININSNIAGKVSKALSFAKTLDALKFWQLKLNNRHTCAIRGPIPTKSILKQTTPPCWTEEPWSLWQKSVKPNLKEKNRRRSPAWRWPDSTWSGRRACRGLSPPPCSGSRSAAGSGRSSESSKFNRKKGREAKLYSYTGFGQVWQDFGKIYVWRKVFRVGSVILPRPPSANAASQPWVFHPWFSSKLRQRFKWNEMCNLFVWGQNRTKNNLLIGWWFGKQCLIGGTGPVFLLT